MNQKIIVSTWHTTSRAAITSDVVRLLVVGQLFSDLFFGSTYNPSGDLQFVA